MQNCCIVHIHKQLSLALCTEGQAKKLMLGSLKSVKFLPVINHNEDNLINREPSSLIDMYHFSTFLKEKIVNNLGKELVLCAGQSSDQITRAVLLLGSFLILHEGLSPKEVAEAFKPIQNRILDFHEVSCVGGSSEIITVFDCWDALSVARTLNWIDFRSGPRDDGTSPLLDMDEYAQYESPVNGNLYLAVPPKFVVFPCPTDLGPHRRWMDMRGARYFSPAFYSDLFAHLGVSLVIRAAPCDYDASPFDAHGIEVEDLLDHPAAVADDDDPRDEVTSSDTCAAAAGLLRAADRLCTLAGATDGLIAVHGAARRSGIVTLGSASAALASYLVSRHHFPAKAAVAWLRIAVPSLTPPPSPPPLPRSDARALQAGAASSDDEDFDEHETSALPGSPLASGSRLVYSSDDKEFYDSEASAPPGSPLTSGSSLLCRRKVGFDGIGLKTGDGDEDAYDRDVLAAGRAALSAPATPTGRPRWVRPEAVRRRSALWH